MKLKKISMKVGLVCGMIVTMAGAYDAVINSIGNTIDTFEKEKVETMEHVFVPEWFHEEEMLEKGGQQEQVWEPQPYGPHEFVEEPAGASYVPEDSNIVLYHYLLPTGLAMVVAFWLAGRNKKD